jgi:hypothetical protein
MIKNTTNTTFIEKLIIAIRWQYRTVVFKKCVLDDSWDNMGEALKYIIMFIPAVILLITAPIINLLGWIFIPLFLPIFKPNADYQKLKEIEDRNQA